MCHNIILFEFCDNSSPFKTSSPSNGVQKTEESGWINTDPQSSFWGDRHYYTYDLDGWKPTSYPDGPRFVSEYGKLASSQNNKLGMRLDNDKLRNVSCTC